MFVGYGVRSEFPDAPSSFYGVFHRHDHNLLNPVPFSGGFSGGP
jgi:hypothetical protein